jgi:hypothetical protein
MYILTDVTCRLSDFWKVFNFPKVVLDWYIAHQTSFIARFASHSR